MRPARLKKPCSLPRETTTLTRLMQNDFMGPTAVTFLSEDALYIEFWNINPAWWGKDDVVTNLRLSDSRRDCELQGFQR